MTPTEVAVAEPARKVVGEAANGSFCVLPRHLDFATSLTTGILRFENEAGEEEHLAIDKGTLVKYGSSVLVTARRVLRGAPLGRLREKLEKELSRIEDQRRKSQSAVARLEASLVRRFLEIQRHA
jgi:F-type H+-transporting ATPase subunit epsilon